MPKELKGKYKKEIENIIGKLRCPKAFRCYESGFDDLCSAKDIGIESFLLCLEEKPEDCKFSVPIQGPYLCHCPLRIYLCKKLRK